MLEKVVIYYNVGDYKKLSQNRANSVAAVLRKKGVRDFQMEVAGYGSEHPLKFGAADDPTKDRRVEIIPLQSKY